MYKSFLQQNPILRRYSYLYYLVEIERTSKVYFIKNWKWLIKIWYSDRNNNVRYKEIENSWEKVEIISELMVHKEISQKCEAYFHKKFKSKRVYWEWFQLDIKEVHNQKYLNIEYEKIMDNNFIIFDLWQNSFIEMLWYEDKNRDKLRAKYIEWRLSPKF